MKIFLDGGAHAGESIYQAREMFGDEIRIFAFEPIKRYIDLLINHFGKDPLISIIHGALSAVDGETTLFYSTLSTRGSTILYGKKSGNIKYDSPGEIIKTFRLSSWIRENIPGEKFLLKLNIEGSEYDVLEDLIRERMLDNIKELYVNWHSKKFNKTFLKREQKIRKILRKQKIFIQNWPRPKRKISEAKYLRNL